MALFLVVSGSPIDEMRISSWSPGWMVKRLHGKADWVLRLNSALEKHFGAEVGRENICTEAVRRTHCARNAAQQGRQSLSQLADNHFLL
jgi:hypothetical protein